MKRVFAFLLLSIAFCGGLQGAAKPWGRTSHKRRCSEILVQKYLEVTYSKEMMTKVMDARAAPTHQMMHEQYLKDKLPPDFETRMNKMMDDMFKSLSLD